MMVAPGVTHEEAWAMRIDESVMMLLARAKLMKRTEAENRGSTVPAERVLPNGTREVRFSGTPHELMKLVGKGARRGV